MRIVSTTSPWPRTTADGELSTWSEPVLGQPLRRPGRPARARRRPPARCRHRQGEGDLSGLQRRPEAEGPARRVRLEDPDVDILTGQERNGRATADDGIEAACGVRGRVGRADSDDLDHLGGDRREDGYRAAGPDDPVARLGEVDERAGAERGDEEDGGVDAPACSLSHPPQWLIAEKRRWPRSSPRTRKSEPSRRQRRLDRQLDRIGTNWPFGTRVPAASRSGSPVFCSRPPPRHSTRRSPPPRSGYDEPGRRPADDHAARAHEALLLDDRAQEERTWQAAWPGLAHVRRCSAAIACPPGSVPDGLPPGETTGGRYSIGRADTPEARLLMSRLNGTTSSKGVPSGVNGAVYASPTTRAVTMTSKPPAS